MIGTVLREEAEGSQAASHPMNLKESRADGMEHRHEIGRFLGGRGGQAFRGCIREAQGEGDALAQGCNERLELSKPVQIGRASCRERV